MGLQDGVAVEDCDGTLVGIVGLLVGNIVMPQNGIMVGDCDGSMIGGTVGVAAGLLVGL